MLLVGGRVAPGCHIDNNWIGSLRLGTRTDLEFIAIQCAGDYSEAREQKFELDDVMHCGEKDDVVSLLAQSSSKNTQR